MAVVPPTKLGWVEAYRGIAATAVILYHTARHFDKNYDTPRLESVFQFGHAGVDLFFVISGFIILFVHFDDIGQPGRVRHYLGRRLTRLLPAYWVAVALTIAVSQLSGHVTDWSDVAWAALPVPTFSEPVLDVAWTLQYEFVFYAAFAVLIINRTAGLILMVAWLAGVALAAATGWHPGLPPTYLGIFNIEFFAGMAVAYRLRRGSLPQYRVVLGIGIVLFVAAAVAEDLGWMDGYTPFARLAYGLPSVLILLGGVEASRRSNIRIPRLLRTLGTASYSLYLFHFLLIGLLWKFWLAAGLGATSPAIGVAVFAALAIAGGIVLSRLVEYPLMRLMREPLGWWKLRSAARVAPDTLLPSDRGAG
ncbi:acyltransferase family protein [Rhodopila sp.]|uniref:acyltransferase family protein n=1 Tax=Rhodopila sp. TaxID=2480087 RepID=UPI002C91E9C3|nr:acyltransferase [Rhodopila sp.]HVZ09971.1 acyltransferase [Rhodopila sp.]